MGVLNSCFQNPSESSADCPSQPLAQIEQQEIRKIQRDVILGKWAYATIDKNPERFKEDQITKKSVHSLTFKAPIMTAADDKFCNVFPDFPQK